MVDFFRSIFNWFVENKDEIVLFFTSTNVISLIGAIVVLVKSIKSTKSNSNVSKDLQQSIDIVNDTAKNLTTTSEEVKASRENTEKLKEEMNELSDRVSQEIDLILSKVNSMIEVQSIVYSTISDGRIRKAVNGILVEAKHSESKTRAELQKEVEELKNKVAENINSIKNDVEQTVSNVNKAVSIDKSKTNNVPRC